MKKKYLISIIIVLILVIPVSSATNQCKITRKNVSLEDFDLAITEIIPYKYYEVSPMFYVLIFGATIKNVGDEKFPEGFGLNAVAVNLRNNEEVQTFSYKHSGGLNPGDFYYDPLGGLIFDFVPLVPTQFSLRFTATPADSNPENNYYEETFLIWNGFGGPNYMKIPKSKTTNRPYINMPFQWFTQENPGLILILSYLFRL